MNTISRVLLKKYKCLQHNIDLFYRYKDSNFNFRDKNGTETREFTGTYKSRNVALRVQLEVFIEIAK